MMTMMTAAQAISLSIREDRTVTVPADLRDDVLAESEDSADVDGTLDAWGVDERGRPWRIAVAVQS